MLHRWFFFLCLSITKAENISLTLYTRTLFLVQWTAFPSCSLLDLLTWMGPSSSFSVSFCIFPSTFSSFYFRMMRDDSLTWKDLLVLVAKLLAIQSFPALAYIIHIWYGEPFVHSYLPSRHTIFAWAKVWGSVVIFQIEEGSMRRKVWEMPI